MILKNLETVRAVVTMPSGLIERSRTFVGKGAFPTRNALIVAALEHFLMQMEREEIDRQFEMMADDSDYLALNEQLANF